MLKIISIKRIADYLGSALFLLFEMIFRLTVSSRAERSEVELFPPRHPERSRNPSKARIKQRAAMFGISVEKARFMLTF